MPGDIQKNILLVVSDTAMYTNGDELLAYEPVVRELNAISDLFDEIIWLGSKVKGRKASLVSVENKKIKTVILPDVRRKNLNALFSFFAYPVFLFNILKYLPKATHVHTRGPSHPAWLNILLSLRDNNRKYLHKYAGDWVKDNIPTTYLLQRNLLKKITRKNITVSVNGKEQTEQNNIVNVPNPCIDESHLPIMNAVGKEKVFSDKIKLLFVGNLQSSKGIIELLNALKGGVNDCYEELYIVGSGALIEEVKQKATEVNRLKIIITGTISRDELNELYAQTHLMILPSVSEGFPKVIAEAAAYGCIPVATSLAGIRSYIENQGQGFLMNDNSPETISDTLNRVAEYTDLKTISNNAMIMSSMFTYEKFRNTVAGIYGLEERI